MKRRPRKNQTAPMVLRLLFRLRLPLAASIFILIFIL